MNGKLVCRTCSAPVGTKQGPWLVVPQDAAIRWNWLKQCWMVTCAGCQTEREWRGKIAREVRMAA